MLWRTFTASFSLLATLATTVRAEDKVKAAIAAIEGLGGSVLRIAANTDDQEVQFYLSDKEITNEALKHTCPTCGMWPESI
jgi:hypothetical protein